VEDALEMARALVDLGFGTVAVSPHVRPEAAPAQTCLERLHTLESALVEARIPLQLRLSAENTLTEDGFLDRLATAEARLVHQGPFVLVEAPYAAPVPALGGLVFQMRRRGVTPLFAHPERCLEFQRPDRAAEMVSLGARLQLDVGALTGRYGPAARRTARMLLEADLYAVAATDLHGPTGAREWLRQAIGELRARVGEGGVQALLRDTPARILRGEAVEKPGVGGVDGGTP
jgi:protein-tyrosine phosphatase